MISLVDRPGSGPGGLACRGPTATPPIAARTPGRNHRPRKKPRRSDPTSSPPSLSDRRLPQKAFLLQSLSRTKTPYPGVVFHHLLPFQDLVQKLAERLVSQESRFLETDDGAQVAPHAVEIVELKFGDQVVQPIDRGAVMLEHEAVDQALVER